MKLARWKGCDGKPLMELNKVFIAFNNADVDDDDMISYKQWTTSGQSKLQQVTETASNIISLLCIQAIKATSHQFAVKAQSVYLRQLKQDLKAQTELIIPMDFADNYSFICQNAIQGFHWETTQTTLYPFAIYFRENEAVDLKCWSACIVSDEKKHGATTVHKFILELLMFLKTKFPQTSMIYYFGDGAGGQYKNCKNFANLCCHYDDFGIRSELNFFATSHGKSPCDGIGGTVKRLVRRASLQAVTTGHILTPQDFYTWASENIKNIHFFFVSSEEVNNHKHTIENRMQEAKTVKGSRSHHKFVPVSKHELQMYRFSSDDASTVFNIGTNEEQQVDPDELPLLPTITATDLYCGKYVAAVYDMEWYVGIISEIPETHQDVLINFMHRMQEANTLFWPSRMDDCYVPLDHILCFVPMSNLMQRRARQYQLDKPVIDEIASLMQAFNERNK